MNIYVPVTLIPPEQLQLYNQFCDETLWSLLHYDYSCVSGNHLEKQWSAYQAVNLRFAEAITEIYEEGDLIWIHNYHLMLLPAMLRKRLWNAKIGFFLYTPFPSAEIFRILPYRCEILRGVLGADLAGFSTWDYSKQFNRSCVRLLGVEATPKVIEVEAFGAAVCRTGIYPAGIDVRALKSHVASKKVKKRVGELKEKFGSKKIIVGVDRLDDCFSGIPLKLLAFEDFLTAHPDWGAKVVFVQVAMLPRQSRSYASYKAQARMVNEIVGRVNSTFGTLIDSPVHYINAEIVPEELYALMCVGHAYIHSPIRDGNSLIPYEWAVCQHDTNKGCLILSEFAGSAHSFATALHVNPWSITELAKLIWTALKVPADERARRSDAAYDFVTTHTARLWGLNFLEDLEQAERFASSGTTSDTNQLHLNEIMDAYRKRVSKFRVGPSAESSGRNSSRGSETSEMTSKNASSPTLGFSGKKDSISPPMSDNTPQLSSRSPSAKDFPRKRRKRCWKLFVFDYDGCLIPFQAIPQLAIPPPSLLRLLRRLLSASPDNVVLIVSGRDRISLEEWFGSLPVYIAAEHGSFFRTPHGDWSVLFRQDFDPTSPAKSPSPGKSQGSIDINSIRTKTELFTRSNKSIHPSNAKVGSGNDSSQSNSANISEHLNPSVEWKAQVRPVMEHFAERTPGAMLEEGEATLTWHYNDADTDFGRWQVRDLQKNLESFLLQRLSIEVVTGDERCRWIKVKPSGVDKAVAIEKVIGQLRENADQRSPTTNQNGYMHHDKQGKVEERITNGKRGTLQVNGLLQSGKFQSRTEIRYMSGRHNGPQHESHKRWNSFQDLNTFVMDSDNEGKSTDGGEKSSSEKKKQTCQLDFILCVGDDRSDEGMFDLLNNEGRLTKLGIDTNRAQIFTVKVGLGGTGAMYTLENTQRLHDVISGIAALGEAEYADHGVGGIEHDGLKT